MKFKKGDRVKRTQWFWNRNNLAGRAKGAAHGTVTGIEVVKGKTTIVRIKWDDMDYRGFTWFEPYDKDLVLVLNGLQKAIIKAKA